jgi:hypothetical protein
MDPSRNIRWYFDDKRGIDWCTGPADCVGWVLHSQRREVQYHAQDGTTGNGYPRLEPESPIAQKFQSKRSHVVTLGREMCPEVEDELLRGTDSAGPKNRESYVIADQIGIVEPGTRPWLCRSRGLLPPSTS